MNNTRKQLRHYWQHDRSNFDEIVLIVLSSSLRTTRPLTVHVWRILFPFISLLVSAKTALADFVRCSFTNIGEWASRNFFRARMISNFFFRFVNRTSKGGWTASGVELICTKTSIKTFPTLGDETSADA